MRKLLNYIIVIIFASILSSCRISNSTAKEDLTSDDHWVSIFNGTNLDDWKVKIKNHPLDDNWKNTFIVVDSAIRVDYSSYDTFDESYGHIFYKNPYSNYRLKLQYRFIGEQVPGGAGWAQRNSGVMIHCQAPETMELNQDFPTSLEVQLLGGLIEGEERSTGNLCTPGTHVVMDNELVTTHCIGSSSGTYYSDKWVDLEVVVWNDSIISHYIDGKKVIEYTKPVISGDDTELNTTGLSPLKKGFISLQSESHSVEFKNIMLLEL